MRFELHQAENSVIGDASGDWMLDPEWGSDVASHIVLPDIKNEKSGVAAERDWVKKNHPNHRWIQQRCRKNEAGRQIDEVILLAPDGVQSSVFFDITDWYGKS
jgi:hypothetical protein